MNTPTGDCDWIEHWSQWEERLVYESLAQQSLDVLVHYPPPQSFWIFNCSDGPSTYGFISSIRRRSPQSTFTVSDISPTATKRCAEYLGTRNVDGFQSVVIPTQDIPDVYDTYRSDAFMSFEPVGSMMDLYAQMYELLPPQGQIIIAARSLFCFGIQGVRRTMKEYNKPFDIHDNYCPNLRQKVFTLVATK